MVFKNLVEMFLNGKIGGEVNFFEGEGSILLGGGGGSNLVREGVNFF